jgi:hypothetical protein
MASSKRRPKAFNDDIARGNTGTADQNPGDVRPQDHFGPAAGRTGSGAVKENTDKGRGKTTQPQR